MSMIGADVGELRSAAKVLTQQSDQLQSTLKSLNSAASNVAMWRGPDGDRFRAEWKSQSASYLSNAIAALRDGADTLRRNADQQEQASRAGTGASSGGGATAGRAAAEYGNSAGGLSDMWTQLKSVPNGGDMSGYRIQEVRGADGETRYIVYVGGTTGGLSDHQSPVANIGAISGNVDKEQAMAIYNAIPKDAEVMFVGYSQGGIDAQNLAASGAFNVTQIVTFGSPVRNDLNIPAIHLRDSYDPIPGTGIFNPTLYGASAQPQNGNVEVFSGRSSIDTPWGMDEHMNGYSELAGKWDDAARTGADTRAGDAASNLKSFQGVVTDQADIKRDGTLD